jgi:hypothetical protein
MGELAAAVPSGTDESSVDLPDKLEGVGGWEVWLKTEWDSPSGSDVVSISACAIGSAWRLPTGEGPLAVLGRSPKCSRASTISVPQM